MASAILLISCPDQPGLVAKVTAFLYEHHGNILDLHQHVDRKDNIFFMRTAWDLDSFDIPPDDIATAFEPIANQHNMTWDLHFSNEKLKMAIFVSKHAHCLYDLLARWQSGEFVVDIPLIISNHPDQESAADAFDIPYYHLPITKATKQEQEAAQLNLLAQHQVDFVVLARYMQVLTADFVSYYPNRIINIHHSFLPAFAGAKPYHRAHERGVKIIGATTHYVTAELDGGPIIAQNVANTDHQDAISDLIRKGRDLEKTVLARGVYLHLQHRILVYNNKTIVFA
jgi:formyltetrahydrofolate deformylase